MARPTTLQLPMVAVALLATFFIMGCAADDESAADDQATSIGFASETSCTLSVSGMT
jgi:hypothetical protein